MAGTQNEHTGNCIIITSRQLYPNGTSIAQKPAPAVQPTTDGGTRLAPPSSQNDRRRRERGRRRLARVGLR
ncbi:unnamed protein product [Caenorhabditis auriculariae]|uniref:Uncharacterized protein n=1 Tax=Caenorhabditis auriculariae TaxID=2777116 RepID=A0A8S1H630_9PELO|nr:unnamed protein product [Caenorhabditis auriculariae]